MHEFIVKTREPEFFEEVHFQLIQTHLVHERELVDVFAFFITTENFVREIDAGPSKVQTVFIECDVEIGVASIVDESFDFAVFNFDGEYDDSALIRSTEIDFFGGRLPDDFSDIEVELVCQVAHGLLFPVVQHEIVLIRFKTGSSHGPVGDVFSIGRINRLVVVGGIGGNAVDRTASRWDDENVVVGGECT